MAGHGNGIVVRAENPERGYDGDVRSWEVGQACST